MALRADRGALAGIRHAAFPPREAQAGARDPRLREPRARPSGQRQLSPLRRPGPALRALERVRGARVLGDADPIVLSVRWLRELPWFLFRGGRAQARRRPREGGRRRLRRRGQRPTRRSAGSPIRCFPRSSIIPSPRSRASCSTSSPTRRCTSRATPCSTNPSQWRSRRRGCADGWSARAPPCSARPTRTPAAGRASSRRWCSGTGSGSPASTRSRCRPGKSARESGASSRR